MLEEQRQVLWGVNMPQLQVLEGVPSFGARIGQGLGAGIGEGITQRLQQYHEQNSNLSSANSLAKQLNIPEGQRSNFVNSFKNIPAKEQLGQFEKLMMAQVYGNYLSQGQRQPEFSNEPRLGVQDAPAQMQQAQQIPPKPKIGGFDFEQDELKKLQRKPVTPPFGPFQKQAELEDKSLRENRKEIAQYSKPFENVSELQSNVKKLQEAKNIIESEDFNVSKFRKGITGILEGEESPVAELFKTPAQQKLFALLRDSLKPKDIGGSNPSTREVLIAMSAIPSYLKGKEANKYIIDKMIEAAEQNLDKGMLISGLRKYNDSASPSDFKDAIESKISKKYDQKPVESQESAPTAINPKTGQKLILRDGKWQLLQ